MTQGGTKLLSIHGYCLLDYFYELHLRIGSIHMGRVIQRMELEFGIYEENKWKRKRFAVVVSVVGSGKGWKDTAALVGFGSAAQGWVQVGRG